MDVEKSDRYHSDDESTEALLGEQRGGDDVPSRRHRSWSVATICNGILFITSLGLFIASTQTKPSVQAALKRTSTYTPVFDDTTIRLQTTKLNGSLFTDPNSPSPWYGLPTDPPTEAAWDAFELIRTIPLTASQIHRMGKDPSTIAKFPDPVFHLGSDAYIGALDFFHQVHCLNMLRKAAFQGNAGIAGNKKLETVHLQHCTDMLMQHLLCTADAGMITYQWVEGNEHPFPDFGVQRECRDWRKLVEWRDGHAVDLETYVGFVKPEGVEEVTISEEEKERMRMLEMGDDDEEKDNQEE